MTDFIEYGKKPPEYVLLSNGRYLLERGVKLETVKEVVDEGDLHEMSKGVTGITLIRIPKGTIITVDKVWWNFYGKYVRCTYEGKVFDIHLRDLKYIKQ